MKNKRWLAVLLVLCVVVCCLPMTARATTASGTCGSNLTWTLDSSGTLTISGTGKMTDFFGISDNPWWDEYSSNIKHIQINSGVTSIGDLSFKEFSNVTSVNIPDSVVSIGSAAFSDCESLCSISIPENVSSIGSSAFGGCKNLSSITLPDGISTIERSTFINCEKLTNIKLPSELTTIGQYAFRGCSE